MPGRHPRSATACGALCSWARPICGCWHCECRKPALEAMAMPGKRVGPGLAAGGNGGCPALGQTRGPDDYEPKEGAHGCVQDHLLHRRRSFWRSAFLRHSRARRPLVARTVMAATARRKAQIPRVANSPAVGVSGRPRAARACPVLALNSNTQIRPRRQTNSGFRGAIWPSNGATPEQRARSALTASARSRPARIKSNLGGFMAQAAFFLPDLGGFRSGQISQ